MKKPWSKPILEKIELNHILFMNGDGVDGDNPANPDVYDPFEPSITGPGIPNNPK